MNDQLIAMIVEDNRDSMESRLRFVRSAGFTAIPVLSFTEAMRQVRAIPAVDIVITDINLDAQVEYDKSGVLLAAKLKEISDKLPVVGYSAHFADGQLSDVELAVFDDYVRRGRESSVELDKHLDLWVEKAREHRAYRRTWADQQIERLQDKYGLRPTNIETLRQFAPIGTQDQNSIDALLSQVGFKLRVLEPGTIRPTEADSENARVIAPLLLWLREEDGVFIAQVFAYPELYGCGDAEVDAIEDVMLLMDGFHRELVLEKPTVHMSAITQRLQSFLAHVFGSGK